MLFRSNARKIIIVGLNNLSIYLSKKLSKDYDIVLLDKNIEYEEYEIDVILDSYEEDLLTSLMEHNIEKTDYFFALSENAEFNLFVAQLARKMGAKKTTALVKENGYLDIQTEIDLVFNPQQILVDQISNALKETRLRNIKNVIPGKVNITRLNINREDPFSYIKIKNLELNDSLVIALSRNDKMFLPDPDTQIIPGDNLYIIYKQGMIKHIFRKLKLYKPKKRLFIIGGNDLGLTIIKKWNSFFEPIIIIEPDLNICNDLAVKLEKILILNGEGTDLRLLKEEGLDSSSIFLAISNNDYNNLLSSFCAKKMDCKQIITLLNNDQYKEIGNLLELENVFILPDIIYEFLLGFLKSGWKFNKFILGETIYTSRVKISKNSRAIDKKIKELNLPKGIVIGTLIRENQVIIPDGEVTLLENDVLLVFFYKKYEGYISNIFKLNEE
jgi:trk system potassium uptake protein TrkA